LKLRGYLVLVASIAILTTVFSRWQDARAKQGGHDVDPAILSGEDRRGALVEAIMERQQERITNILLNGIPLRWERSLTRIADNETHQPVRRFLYYGFDSEGTARLHLIFRAEDGTLDCISVLKMEESAEPRMSRSAGERVAGVWLNRIGLPQGGVWEFAGSSDEEFRPDQRMVYSRWQATAWTAFIGIERRTGAPTFIRFRPLPNVQVGGRKGLPKPLKTMFLF
jgi:hypothetical protein